jgi:hypothetical protein
MNQPAAVPAMQGLDPCRLAWIDQIAYLPNDWALCAVNGQKKPFNPNHPKGQGWQKAGLDRGQFANLNGKLRAVGLLLGPLSGGIVAIDHDGHSADSKITEISGIAVDRAMPQTVSFTSQREGRYQALYRVPQELWDTIKTRKFYTGVTAIDSGKEEALELRWAGTQSVILGDHPDTDGYQWLDGRSPWDVPIADAPDWIYLAMRDDTPSHVFEPRQDWKIERPLEIPIPLQNLVTKKHQQYIEQGAAEGSRNDSGAAIARDLIGAEQWARESNVYYESTAELLFWQFAVASGLSERETQAIWRSAQRGNPTPSLSVEGLQNVLKAWEKKNKPALNPVKSLQDEHAKRIRIEIPLQNHQYSQAVDSIIEGLSIEPDYLQAIYIQGSDFSEKWPVRILMNPDKSVRIIDPLTPDKVHVELEKRFLFTKYDKKGAATPFSCPDRIAKSFLSEGQWLPLKPLERLARIPLLQWDGQINQTPGYYHEDKTLLDVKKGQFTFKVDPTKEDALSAIKSIKYFLREFHFKDLLGVHNKLEAPSIDRSGAIAALLTAVSRHLYDFAPCFITNAHTPGSGKGTLASVISVIQDGKVQSERTWNPDPVELDKVILSELLTNPPSLVIGNIDSRFGGAIIESMLTKTQYPGRILGKSQMVYPSTQTLFMANGNNLNISKDMTRRTIMTRLDCGVEKPQDIKYQVNDIVGYTKAHRSKLFVQAVTILQAFLLSGEIENTRSKLNGFEDWDKLVRGSLLWLNESDPVESQIALAEDDDEGILLGRFIDCFVESMGESYKTFTELKSFAENRDYANRPIAPNEFIEVFHEACFNPRSKEYCQTKFGHFINKSQGQVKNGFCIERGTGRMRRHFRIKKMPISDES